jgi:hypothetical protein
MSNLNLLVSRNKREGYYYGHYKRHVRFGLAALEPGFLPTRTAAKHLESFRRQYAEMLKTGLSDPF